MSIVQEIVQKMLKPSSRADLKTNLPKLLDEIKYYKSQTKKYVEDKYVDFLFQLPKNENYFNDCETLFADTQAVLNAIEHETKGPLTDGQAELEQYKLELQKIIIELRVLTKILRIDDLLLKIEYCSSNESNNLNLEHINHVFELETILKEPDRILHQLNCFENINERYLFEKDAMLENLKKKFSQLVQLNEKQFQNNKLVNVKITTDDVELKRVVDALVSTNFNPSYICNFLMNNIFSPLMTKPTSIDVQENNSSFVELKLSFSVKPPAEGDTSLRPNYKIVFRNLQIAWNCLNKMNIFIEKQNLCIFKIFGDYMKDKFIKLLLDECLYKAVPGTMDEMKDSTLIQDVKEMNTFLADLNFFGETEPEIEKFLNSVGLLFRRKFSMNILNNAVDIMRRDLSDMVVISSGDDSRDQDENNPVIFPKCMISKSTVELINLMNKIISQMELSDSGDEQTKIQLLSTISIILDRYITEVVTFHQKLLITIPHLTALFYNNCMYLSFWATKNITTLNLASDSQLLVTLRQLGNDHFQEQVKNQKNQIMEILKEFQFNASETELPQNTFRTIRQSLRQLDLLKNVWQTILPDSVYNSTMGALLNDFCAEIIRKILKVEDIHTPVANGLVEVIALINERAPQIFSEPLRVSVIVKSWSKLSQLKMILSASLLEITEHWAEGNGPLTLNFRADEIKHLIRALFKNTKRRADALNTII